MTLPRDPPFIEWLPRSLILEYFASPPDVVGEAPGLLAAASFTMPVT